MPLGRASKVGVSICGSLPLGAQMRIDAVI